MSAAGHGSGSSTSHGTSVKVTASGGVAIAAAALGVVILVVWALFGAPLYQFDFGVGQDMENLATKGYLGEQVVEVPDGPWSKDIAQPSGIELGNKMIAFVAPDGEEISLQTPEHLPTTVESGVWYKLDEAHRKMRLGGIKSTDPAQPPYKAMKVYLEVRFCDFNVAVPFPQAPLQQRSP